MAESKGTLLTVMLCAAMLFCAVCSKRLIKRRHYYEI